MSRLCFSGGSQASFPCVGWMRGAYSVVRTQAIRFVEVVFFWRLRGPFFVCGVVAVSPFGCQNTGDSFCRGCVFWGDSQAPFPCVGWIRGGSFRGQNTSDSFCGGCVFWGDLQAPLSCMGRIRGAHSVGKTHAIRFVEVVFLGAIYRPPFRVWGGCRGLIQLLRYR